MKAVLEKYHGLGNDYLVFDPNKNTLRLSPENVRLICDRHFGAGADGILEGPMPGKDRMQVRIWNPDGSVAEKSGNGVRIFAKYLKDAGYVQKSHVVIDMGGADTEVRYLNEEGTRLKASMGQASFWSDRIPVTGPKREVVNETMMFGRIPYKVTCVSMGNPHAVIFIGCDVREFPLEEIGPKFENHERFPNRVNTEFVRVIDRRTAEMRVWERGSGETLACGTGACAVAVACALNGFTEDEVTVRLLGGDLQIRWDREKDTVFMTGPAEVVFDGEWIG